MNEPKNEVMVAPVRTPLRAGGSVAAIIPQSLEEGFRMAEAFLVAGMVPDSYKGATDRETASRVLIGIMKGAECGLPPVTALSNIYIVNNKPCVYGDGALAIIQAHPQYAGCKEWLSGTQDQDGFTAYCSVSRKLPSGEIIITERHFSWGDAKRARLTTRGPWALYGQRMLQMRARAWTLRDSFADALSGLSIAEEVADIPTKPEEVSTAFLDSPQEPAAVVEPTPPVDKPIDTPRDVDNFDPKALLDSIKKDFVKAGDDAEKNRNIIAAAQSLELPEPFKAELAEILEAKGKRYGKSNQDGR